MKSSFQKFDLFISYRHAIEADRKSAQALAERFRESGLRVFIDEKSINYFDGITVTIQRGLSRSKALLVYLTKDYLASQVCVWELTSAFIAARQLGEPTERIFIVNPEKTAEHLKELPGELRDAKYVHTIDSALNSLPKRLTDLKETFQDTISFKKPNVIGRSITGSNRFVGRLREMWRLHSNLNTSLYPAVTEGYTGPDIALISGMGGIGKTLLAEEYALRFGSSYPGGIYWLDAHGSFNPSKPDIESFKALCKDQFLKILKLCGESPPVKPKLENLKAVVVQFMERKNQRCLWVVDDIPFGLSDHQNLLEAWFAPHPLACTLITTRSREYKAFGKELALDVFDSETGMELLKKHNIDITGQKDAAQNLIERLGGHAMALDIAGTIVAYDCDIEAYLTELDQDVNELIDTPADLIGALPSGHERSIVSTYKHSLLKLGTSSRDYMRLAANLSPAAISKRLTQMVFQKTDKLENIEARKLARRAIRGCYILSLVKSMGDAHQVHALTSAVVRYIGWDSDERGLKMRQFAIEGLSSIIQPDMSFEKGIKIYSELEHARYLTSTLKSDTEIGLLYHLVYFDYHRGNYALSAENCKRLYKFNSELHGPEHPDTLTSMEILASNLFEMGNGKEALRLHEEVLERRKNVHGLKHHDTLASMNNVAASLRNNGFCFAAQRLQKKVLNHSRNVLGPDHELTLTSMANLAEDLWMLGKFKKARRLQEEALECGKKVLGPDAPLIITIMSNLAGTLRDMKDYEGAQQLHEEVLERSRKILGPDHPDTLQRMLNLELTLRKRGDYEGAKRLSEEVLERSGKFLGHDNPKTFKEMNDLGEKLWMCGNYMGAKRIFEEVLERSKEILGQDHPDTLTIMNNLAQTLREMGDHESTRRINEFVLERRSKVLGQNHLHTIKSMSNVAVDMITMGDYNGARQIQEKVIKRYKKFLGRNHRQTITSLNNLASILLEMGDRKAAREFQKKALKRSSKALGQDDPLTLTIMSNLAANVAEMGSYHEALQLFEEVLERRREVLGPDHPHTLESFNILAEISRALELSIGISIKKTNY